MKHELEREISDCRLSLSLSATVIISGLMLLAKLNL